MTDETTTNTTDSEVPSRNERTYPRRPLLKALGVGATLSLGSSTATATSDRSTTAEHGTALYGYPAPDASKLPDDLEPDHEVTLHTVEAVPGEHGPLFHFEPTGLQVAPGDLVQFTYETPDHTITAYHPAHGFQRRVPEDVPPFSSPVVNAGGAWLYRFEQPGLYDLYCGPHHILGMTMRIVVGEMSADDVPAYEDTFEGAEGPPPLLAPFSKEFLERELHEFSQTNENCEWVWLTPQEVLATSALDPSSIQESGSVSFEDVVAEIDRISGGDDSG